jgi:hypothetical protein
MADTKISALTAASTPLAGTEVLPIVQSGTTVKVANNDLRPKQIQSNATSGVLQVVGPAAAATRVMTTPDANFTAARTDAAQTFTGDQTFSNNVLLAATKNVLGNDDSSYIALGASSASGAATLYLSGSTRGGGNAATATLGSSGFQIFNNIFSALNFEVLAAGGIAPGSDAAFSCGTAAKRWSVIYSSTPLINTSDANLKQDIEELNEAEKRVAVRLKSLIKKFKFKDAVQQKGDAARIHVGVIAQDVQAAFEAEGLDADRYGVFCSDTWWEAPVEKVLREATEATDETSALDEIRVTVIETVPEGTPNAAQKTQLGVRYDQLFAFVISSL